MSSLRIPHSPGKDIKCVLDVGILSQFAMYTLAICIAVWNSNWFIFQISWSKKNGLLDSGLKFQEGSIYTIHNISRHQAGIYKCQASNGVGYPVLEEINLTVLCKYWKEFFYPKTYIVFIDKGII